ncbi:hypothetical protein B296_00041103 [Ensete ventricosum]|uniref:Uncharacterized protein n=1 Tax=Ensete ventricosum TaxID=4639 RepID=A0A426XIB7_ENSVE|nr:hypothetical protein B296_00041103 [Ensete ventricosum]
MFITITFFAKPCLFDFPWANTLGIASLLNFRDGARKIDRNLTSRVTMRKVYDPWKADGRFYNWRFQAWKDDNRFCNQQFQAWKGDSFFSSRHGMASRARNDGGCAAIGAGFTAALRSYDKSDVERTTATSAIGDSGVGRVVASSPLGSWRSLERETPWIRVARRVTLLRIPLLCSSGILRWLLPSGLHWLLHNGTPLSSNRWFLHSRKVLLPFSLCWFLSSSRWLLHSGRGLLLSSSRWFLPSGLGRFPTRMFHCWFLLGGMLLQ